MRRRYLKYRHKTMRLNNNTRKKHNKIIQTGGKNKTNIASSNGILEWLSGTNSQLRKEKHLHSHKKTQKRKFKKERCSAASPTNTDSMEFTCYDKSTLLKMRDLWNTRHQDSKITTDSPKEIWEQLKTNMSNSCDRESCWIKSKLLGSEISRKIVDDIFAPHAPKEWNHNIDEWLSSLDIIRLMNQFEKKYKEFEFLGPSPIDYDTHMFDGSCVWEELCEFSLSEQIKRNKTKIGIVFNTDPHYKSGQHWIAIFIDIPRQEVIYFDSYGEPPERQFRKFMKNVIQQGEELGMKFKQIVNKRRHQYSDGQCGMYSMHFIIELLKGKDANTLISSPISDDLMRRLRKRYFNVED